MRKLTLHLDAAHRYFNRSCHIPTMFKHIWIEAFKLGHTHLYEPIYRFFRLKTLCNRTDSIRSSTMERTGLHKMENSKSKVGHCEWQKCRYFFPNSRKNRNISLISTVMWKRQIQRQNMKKEKKCVFIRSFYEFTLPNNVLLFVHQTIFHQRLKCIACTMCTLHCWHNLISRSLCICLQYFFSTTLAHAKRKILGLFHEISSIRFQWDRCAAKGKF